MVTRMEEVMRCDWCGRTADGGDVDFIYSNPHKCKHDLCSNHLTLGSAMDHAQGCRVCQGKG